LLLATPRICALKFFKAWPRDDIDWIHWFFIGGQLTVEPTFTISRSLYPYDWVAYQKTEQAAFQPTGSVNNSENGKRGYTVVWPQDSREDCSVEIQATKPVGQVMAIAVNTPTSQNQRPL
jgi:hypothetical protein